MLIVVPHKPELQTARGLHSSSRYKGAQPKVACTRYPEPCASNRNQASLAFLFENKSMPQDCRFEECNSHAPETLNPELQAPNQFGSCSRSQVGGLKLRVQGYNSVPVQTQTFGSRAGTKRRWRFSSRTRACPGTTLHPELQTDPTESVCSVVSQKSIPAQIRQLIFNY